MPSVNSWVVGVPLQKVVRCCFVRVIQYDMPPYHMHLDLQTTTSKKSFINPLLVTQSLFDAPIFLRFLLCNQL